MEIERKFTLKILPDHLEQYPCRHIEQAYLNTDPVIRIRRDKVERNSLSTSDCKSAKADMGDKVERNSLLTTEPSLLYESAEAVTGDNEEYYLTYKGSGMMAREEYNLPINKESYFHMREKADGNVISKKRYLIPLPNPGYRPGFPVPPADYTLTIELDVFDPPCAPLVMAEVEFGSKEAAEAFLPPDWFDEDVTFQREYHNSYLALNCEKE